MPRDCGSHRVDDAALGKTAESRPSRDLVGRGVTKGAYRHGGARGRCGRPDATGLAENMTLPQGV